MDHAHLTQQLHLDTAHRPQGPSATRERIERGGRKEETEGKAAAERERTAENGEGKAAEKKNKKEEDYDVYIRMKED